MIFLFQTPFNAMAAPYQPLFMKSEDEPSTYPIIKVGPSKVAVNGRIWDRIATDRVLPKLPIGFQNHLPSMPGIQRSLNQQPYFNPINLFSAYVSEFSLKYYAIKKFFLMFFVFSESSTSLRRRFHSQRGFHA